MPLRFRMSRGRRAESLRHPCTLDAVSCTSRESVLRSVGRKEGDLYGEMSTTKCNLQIRFSENEDYKGFAI